MASVTVVPSAAVNASAARASIACTSPLLSGSADGGWVSRVVAVAEALTHSLEETVTATPVGAGSVVGTKVVALEAGITVPGDGASLKPEGTSVEEATDDLINAGDGEGAGGDSVSVGSSAATEGRGVTVLAASTPLGGLEIASSSNIASFVDALAPDLAADDAVAAMSELALALARRVTGMLICSTTNEISNFEARHWGQGRLCWESRTLRMNGTWSACCLWYNGICFLEK